MGIIIKNAYPLLPLQPAIPRTTYRQGLCNRLSAHGLYCFCSKRNAQFGRKAAAYKDSQKKDLYQSSMDSRLNPHLPIITPRIEFSSLTHSRPPAIITPRIDFAELWITGSDSASHAVSDFNKRSPSVCGDDNDTIPMDLDLLEEASDDEVPLNNNRKIPKPLGEPGQPNSGGYSVENELQAWGADKISKVTLSLARAEYALLLTALSQKFIKSKADELLDTTQSYSKQNSSEIAKICRSVRTFTSRCLFAPHSFIRLQIGSQSLTNMITTGPSEIY